MSHRQESVVERVGAVVDRGLRVVVGGGAVFHWIEVVLTEGGSMWVLEDRGWCRSVAHKGWMGNCGVPRWRRKKGFLELNWLESRLEMVVQFQIQDRGWFSRRWWLFWRTETGACSYGNAGAVSNEVLFGDVLVFQVVVRDSVVLMAVGWTGDGDAVTHRIPGVVWRRWCCVNRRPEGGAGSYG